jgi:UDP-4-amino-4,6-dideoxy-L-N-acetyl-beta-L-altrosamine transaminase
VESSLIDVIPYSRQLIEQDDIEAVIQVLRSDFLTQGPTIEAFESSLTSFTGARYAVLFSSGTAALHGAYCAAGIAEGDEVITSPITFAATSNAALYLGATPVFVDVESDTGNMDVERIEQAVTPRTKAIVPVHYAGHPVDLETVSRIAKHHGLTVIEDACHALGAEYKGHRKKGTGKNLQTVERETDRKSDDDWIRIGSCAHSDMTVFSFHPVKHITTGEGGAVLTNRSDYHEKLCLFRAHGITKDPSKFTIRNSQSEIRNPDSYGDWYYEMQHLGFNYRMSDIHAALGMSQLRKIERFVSRRREIARQYASAFAGNSWFAIPPERSYARSSYHLYPIRLSNGYSKKRSKIFSALRDSGIGVQVHYIPIYLQPYYREMGYRQDLCPAAADFYQREISIPIYPAMDDAAAKTVIEAIERAFTST